MRVPEPSDLVGLFVVELGERQAWPFIQFCDNRPTPSREVRLYIDTVFDVFLPAVVKVEDRLHRLLALNNLTVGAVEVRGPGLDVSFTDGSRLTISEEAQSWTTGDIWWLTPWR